MNAERPIAEDDLHAYVDGRLDPERMADVKAYLDGHPDVAARVAGHSALRDSLRAALKPYAEEPIPPELSVRNLIARRRQPRRFTVWNSIAACLLCLAIGGGGGWTMRRAGETHDGVSALASAAFDSYHTFASDQVHPVEFRAADEDQLTKWVSNRLHHPVHVPDLTKSGYRFMGGRLVSTPHGPAGLFMYDDDNGTRLGLLTQPMERAEPKTMSEHREHATLGYSWANGGLGYSLVGPEATSGLHPLADEIRRQTSEGA